MTHKATSNSNLLLAEKSKSFLTSFSVSDDFLNARRVRRVVLVFHGVDTFANITLNDHAVGETSNMFLRYTFDVTEHIKVRKSSDVKA